MACTVSSSANLLGNGRPDRVDDVPAGSGIKTRDVVDADRLIASIPLDPTRQLIGSQCSGALVLARLGLPSGPATGNLPPACQDLEPLGASPDRA